MGAAHTCTRRGARTPPRSGRDGAVVTGWWRVRARGSAWSRLSPGAAQGGNVFTRAPRHASDHGARDKVLYGAGVASHARAPLRAMLFFILNGPRPLKLSTALPYRERSAQTAGAHTVDPVYAYKAELTELNQTEGLLLIIPLLHDPVLYSTIA